MLVHAIILLLLCSAWTTSAQTVCLCDTTQTVAALESLRLALNASAASWPPLGDGRSSCTLWSSFLKCSIANSWSLTITNVGLGATLPAADSVWSALSSLTSLSISAPSLTGSLPGAIGALTRLTYLGVTSCVSLQGPLPATLGGTAALAVNLISNTQLSGTLPDSWNNAPIAALTIQSASITGAIPASWNQHMWLQSIFFSSLSISGSLPQWTDMPALASVTIQSCISLTGSLPIQWNSLVSLQSIYLFNLNNIQGTLPRWSSMPRLTSITLQSLPITGTIPLSWEALPNLSAVTMISLTSISGPLPSWSNPASPLTSISINSCQQLGGPLPESWQSLRSLTSVSIVSCSITGPLPSRWWGDSMALATLDLSRNAITGSLPISTSGLRFLTSLRLDNNPLSTTLPPAWGQWTALTLLSCTYCSLSGSLPSFESSISLTSISLTGNLLTGSIPTTWGSALQTLSLAYNMFSTCSISIPKSLISLTLIGCRCQDLPDWSIATSLAAIDLTSNNISGTLATLPSTLRTFSAANNQLSGALHAVFPSAIQHIDVSRNAFTGSLPQWTAWTSLQNVRMRDNRLSGTVPKFGATHLQVVELASNNLNGTLPTIPVNNALDVSDNNFTGSLVVQSGFSFRSLNASRNRFTGALPNLFQGLWGTSIENIDLSSNMFSGTIDVNAALTRVRVLNLSNNALTGSLPEISQSIISLDLSQNLLNGTYVDYSSRYSLATLNLGCNKLSGDLLWSSTSTRNIKVFNVSNNWLTGSIPTTLTAIVGLTVLDLSGNRLHGTLPPTTGTAFSAMTYLYLHGEEQRFSPSTPGSYLSKYPNLRGLGLSAPFTAPLSQTQSALSEKIHQLNKLVINGFLDPSTDVVFQPVDGKLSELVYLDISNNSLSGDPSRLLSPSRFPSLAVLIVSHNRFSGDMPTSWIADFGNLTDLDVSSNPFLPAPLPDSWVSMVRIRYIDVSRCRVTGFLPESWANINTLVSLNVSGNSIESISGFMSRALKLVVLDASSNLLSGTLPNCTSSLDSLNLSFNFFAGNLPQQWTLGCPSLRYLELSDNLLGSFGRDSLEDSTTEWPRTLLLVRLNVSLNRLTGTLPSWWSLMSSLEVLSLAHNRLSGVLPQEWRSMRALKQLQLQHNNLTGSLPALWSPLGNHVVELDLSHNNISGRLPHTWNLLFTNSRVSLRALTLCAPVPKQLPYQRVLDSGASIHFMLGCASASPSMTDYGTPSTSASLLHTDSYSTTDAISRSRTSSILQTPSNVSSATGSLSGLSTLSQSQLSTTVTSVTLTTVTQPKNATATYISLETDPLSHSPTNTASATNPLPLPALDRTAYEVAAATSAAVTAASVLLAAPDISNANIQALLSFMRCDGSAPPSDAAMFVVSPLFRVSSVAMAAGNIGIIIMIGLVWAAFAKLASFISAKPFSHVISSRWCRFPAIPIRVMELWLPGSFMGAVLSLSSSSPVDICVGIAAVIVGVGMLAGWQWLLVTHVLQEFDFRPFPLDVISGWSRVDQMLCSDGVWFPRRQLKSFGVLFGSLKQRCATVKVIDFVLACIASVAAGLSPIMPNMSSCRAVIGILACFFFAHAVFLIVLRPHRMPFDCLTVPMTTIFFVVNCVMTIFDIPPPPWLSILQSLVLIARAVLGLYVSKILDSQLVEKSNSDSADLQEAFRKTDQVPLFQENDSNDRATRGEDTESSEMLSVQLDPDFIANPLQAAVPSSSCADAALGNRAKYTGGLASANAETYVCDGEEMYVDPSAEDLHAQLLLRAEETETFFASYSDCESLPVIFHHET